MPINTQTSIQYQGVVKRAGSPQTDTIQRNEVYASLSERPTAADFGVGSCQIGHDIYTSDGVNWLLISASFMLLRDAKGWIVPSLAAANASTYSQSGATLTVSSTGHSIPNTVHNGKSVYLNIVTVSTGVAPTSSITGWFTDFQYVDANTFTCQATNSQAGTGVVNSNTAETVVTELTTVLNGGTLGVHNGIESMTVMSGTGSANNKRTIAKIGGQTFKNAILTGASNISGWSRNRIVNKGRLNAQLNFNSFAPAEVLSSTGAIENKALDTTTNLSLTHSLRAESANEYAALEYVYVTIV